MSRIRREAVIAGLAVALGVAQLSGGVFKRSAPAANQATPANRATTPRGPAWLNQPPVVHRTTYLSVSPTARGVADDADPRPLVWVLDGAGDLGGCSGDMLEANAKAGFPVELCVFGWSHGYRRLYLDQTDFPHIKAQGSRLAAKILERKKAEPGRRVVLVGHSAGAAVALAAGDILPPDSVDRVILLSPAVSTGYNLRPTLRAAREGVDVFCSKKDWVALGFVTRVVGTADRQWGPTAGRHGFQLKGACSPAEADTGRLRQYFWSPDLAWTGNTGGHHGSHAPGFVQAFLFPLIGVDALG
jgi:hypothetical protein